MQEESPINAIPPVIIVLALVVAGIELMFSAAQAGFLGGAAGVGWRLAALQDYAFSPLVLDRVLSFGDFAPEVMRRFVTYPFIHDSFTQALFAAALLLALGKFVGDVFSAVAVLIVFFGAAIFGAVVFGLIINGGAPLYGAYTALFGLIGAYTYIVWLRLGAAGESRLNAFRLIGFLLALQLVFGLIFGGTPTWIAELAGFVFGFGISIVVAPGGWSALLARLRKRST